MPENSIFQSQITYDRPTHREFNRSVLKTNTGHLILKIFLSLLLLLMLFSALFVGENAGGLALSVYVLIVWVVCFCSIHFGAGYKRTLAANMGQPQQITYCFCEDAILECNADGAVVARFSYDQVRRVIQSKNLYALMLKHRLGILVRKDGLTGGSEDQFLTFLAWHCPKWKANRPSRGTAGQVMDCITGILTVVTLVLSLLDLPAIQLPVTQAGTLTNDMSYQQMADELASVGITISDQAIEELNAFDADYLAEYGVEYYTDNPYDNKAYDLLYWEGAGFYDEETWEWTPSTSGIYYFDLEVWNVDSIYTDFFTGLSAMHSELQFTDVSEDYSNADIEKGKGQVAVSFGYNGMQHTLTAEYDYDWFDTALLNDLGKILAEDSSDNELYLFYDGQGCLVYYGTEENTAALEALCGLDFESAADN